MTMDELLVRERIQTLRRLDPWLRFEEEAREARAGGLRRTLAAALVRLGAWLDRGAIDRIAMVRRQAH
jgi:hypothetical protein